MELVLGMLNETAGKRIRFEGKLAKRSGVDGGKAPKARMFLLVVTPPFDETEGPQWNQVPKVTLECELTAVYADVQLPADKLADD